MTIDMAADVANDTVADLANDVDYDDDMACPYKVLLTRVTKKCVGKRNIMCS